jgi:hypothetical protein
MEVGRRLDGKQDAELRRKTRNQLIAIGARKLETRAHADARWVLFMKAMMLARIPNRLAGRRK